MGVHLMGKRSGRMSKAARRARVELVYIIGVVGEYY